MDYFIFMFYRTISTINRNNEDNILFFHQCTQNILYISYRDVTKYPNNAMKFVGIFTNYAIKYFVDTIIGLYSSWLDQNDKNRQERKFILLFGRNLIPDN